jgi:HKD family nuclease|tara:strand:- start:238 stop:429 length:192 start_codon:yes stop_codon:yes gene_type:complete
MPKKSRQELEDEFMNEFTPSNLIEKISLTFGDRHEHISSDFMPMKEHMKKCEEIIIKSINKKQ